MSNPDAEVLVQVDEVAKEFPVRVDRGRKGVLRAVDGVSLQVFAGETLGLVGESGCGKSTLGRCIVRLTDLTSGSVSIGGTDISHLSAARLRPLRQRMQMVFQDPYSSLNPAKTLGYILSRPLVNYQGLRGPAVRERVMELLETVALTPASRFYNRFAYELSGGQRQRVVIARALAVEPKLIIADEPISSLDVSIRAEVLELLNRLVQDSDVGILYITHDLLSARMLSDEVVVLNEGRVVEQGPSLDVIRHPQDDYTRLLLDAIPNPFSGAERA